MCPSIHCMHSKVPKPWFFSESGFQIDDVSSASDWLIFKRLRFDWLVMSPSWYQFESPPEAINYYPCRMNPGIDSWTMDHSLWFIGIYRRINQLIIEFRRILVGLRLLEKKNFDLFHLAKLDQLS